MLHDEIDNKEEKERRLKGKRLLTLIALIILIVKTSPSMSEIV